MFACSVRFAATTFTRSSEPLSTAGRRWARRVLARSIFTMYPRALFRQDFREGGWQQLERHRRELSGDKALITTVTIARAISCTSYTEGTITNHASLRLGRSTGPAGKFIIRLDN